MMKKAKGQADISHAAYKLGRRLASQNNANPTVLKTQRDAFEKVALKPYTKPTSKLVTGPLASLLPVKRAVHMVILVQNRSISSWAVSNF